MEKTIYTAPAAEVLEIATEGVLCSSEKAASFDHYTKQEFSWVE